jgi:magnesium transporter
VKSGTRAEEIEAAASPQEHLEAMERVVARRRGEGAAGDEALLANEARALLEALHPADVAYVLEGLPLEDRLWVWGLVRSGRDGEILLEVSDAVRDTLLQDMDSAEIVAAAQHLDADEIADLASDLPDEVVQDIIEAQDVEDRAHLQSALSYPEGTVGSLMDFEVVSIREDVSCEVALRYLRRYEELPRQTDALFVVDRADHLKGALPLNRLLVTDPDVLIDGLYDREVVSFAPESDADDAAQSFDRYDLVCAPVVDGEGRVVGRVTVDTVLEYVRDRQEAQLLGQAGLREEEDIFASVWESAKNRGPWLALNLCTAFVASRVVGAFEGSISRLAALAALMPIVAGIGGNSGNQTTTLIVRSLALGQVSASNARRLLAKELGISALNGVTWGGVLGFLAWLLYRNVALGGVMALAMLLNLVVAALAGIFIPLAMQRFGRDPAVGSSVFLTFVTDSMGFFIFLGLATIFLL